jgi:transforming growth factor-beta-induced protein
MSYQDQDQASLGTGPRDNPNATKDLWQTLEQDGRFQRFLAAARTARLENNLRGPDLITVFAVPDDALQSENEDVLKNVVGQHVVHGLQTTADIRTASTLRSFAGQPVTVSWEDGRPRFGNTNVMHGDIACTNGMIHVLDKLMLECSYAS